MRRESSGPVGDGSLPLLHPCSWSVEHGSYLARQSLRRKRLVDELRSLVQHSVMYDAVIYIAGHIQYFHLRAQPSQSRCQLVSTHLRHDDVGEKQMNRLLVAFAEQERGVVILCFQHVVAV